MEASRSFLCTVISLLLISGAMAYEGRPLPSNVYDPITKENEPIATYTFEELDHLLWHSPAFLRWNDGRRVCAYMAETFGRVSSRCDALASVGEVRRISAAWWQRPHVHTTEALVTFTIQPPPLQPSGIIIVDPIYPPYPNW